jgi:hypothetical protein
MATMLLHHWLDLGVTGAFVRLDNTLRHSAILSPLLGTVEHLSLYVRKLMLGFLVVHFE